MPSEDAAGRTTGRLRRDRGTERRVAGRSQADRARAPDLQLVPPPAAPAPSLERLAGADDLPLVLSVTPLPSRPSRDRLTRPDTRACPTLIPHGGALRLEPRPERTGEPAEPDPCRAICASPLPCQRQTNRPAGRDRRSSRLAPAARRRADAGSRCRGLAGRGDGAAPDGCASRCRAASSPRERRTHRSFATGTLSLRLLGRVARPSTCCSSSYRTAPGVSPLDQKVRYDGAGIQHAGVARDPGTRRRLPRDARCVAASTRRPAGASTSSARR